MLEREDDALRSAYEVMIAESAAIQQALVSIQSERFSYLAHLLATCESKVVITGVGKSAISARKLAATLATCTIPAVFIDPVGLYHGELGVLGKKDLVVMQSMSGETEELVRLLDSLKKKGCSVASIVGRADSVLGKLSVSICTSCTCEPFARIPTATSAAMVAVGDALAVCAAVKKQVTSQQLALNHPGGSIGKEATN